MEKNVFLPSTWCVRTFCCSFEVQAYQPASTLFEAPVLRLILRSMPTWVSPTVLGARVLLLQHVIDPHSPLPVLDFTIGTLRGTIPRRLTALGGVPLAVARAVGA